MISFLQLFKYSVAFGYFFAGLSHFVLKLLELTLMLLLLAKHLVIQVTDLPMRQLCAIAVTVRDQEIETKSFSKDAVKKMSKRHTEQLRSKEEGNPYEVTSPLHTVVLEVFKEITRAIGLAVKRKKEVGADP